MLYMHVESTDEKLIILYNFAKHAPLKNVRITKPKAPWLTDNLKLFMTLRDKSLAKYKTKYKDLRNLVNKTVVLD